MTKCAHGQEHRRSFTFSTGETIESCSFPDCDHGAKERRAVLVPGVPLARDPKPREKAELRPASLFAALLATEDPEVAEAEQKEQIANETAAEIAAFEESGEEPLDGSEDFDGGSDDPVEEVPEEEEEVNAEI